MICQHAPDAGQAARNRSGSQPRHSRGTSISSREIIDRRHARIAAVGSSAGSREPASGRAPADEARHGSSVVPRVAVYGFFGIRNIGNECTLQATLANLREHLPQSELFCISADPVRVTRDHGIRSVDLEQGSRADRRARGFRRVAELLLRRLPGELRALSRVFRAIGRNATLVVAGTGVLEEDSTATGALLNLAHWTLAAKLRGGRLVVLSIGTGPVHSRLGRWLCRWILSQADYVSYRDHRSRDAMSRLGVATSRHAIVPDLAFGLPAVLLPAAPAPRPTARRVGIGVMHEGKFADPSSFQRYLREMASFAQWLLDQGCEVELLHGDAGYDLKALEQLRDELRQRGALRDDPRVQIPEVEDASGLLHRIADLDLVVASRFHNIIMSLVLAKPVIALSYHAKIDSLMESLCMQEHCTGIDAVECAWLIDRFRALVRDLPGKSRAIADQVGGFRPLIARQYVLALRPPR